VLQSRCCRARGPALCQLRCAPRACIGMPCCCTARRCGLAASGAGCPALVPLPGLLDGYHLHIRIRTSVRRVLELSRGAAVGLLLSGRAGTTTHAVAAGGFPPGDDRAECGHHVIVPVVSTYALLVGRQWRPAGGWRKIAARVGSFGRVRVSVWGLRPATFRTSGRLTGG